MTKLLTNVNPKSGPMGSASWQKGAFLHDNGMQVAPPPKDEGLYISGSPKLRHPAGDFAPQCILYSF